MCCRLPAVYVDWQPAANDNMSGKPNLNVIACVYVGFYLPALLSFACFLISCFEAVIVRSCWFKARATWELLKAATSRICLGTATYPWHLCSAPCGSSLASASRGLGPLGLITTCRALRLCLPLAALVGMMASSALLLPRLSRLWRNRWRKAGRPVPGIVFRPGTSLHRSRRLRAGILSGQRGGG